MEGMAKDQESQVNQEVVNQNQLEISQEQTGNENGNKKPTDTTFE